MISLPIWPGMTDADVQRVVVVAHGDPRARAPSLRWLRDPVNGFGDYAGFVPKTLALGAA